MEENLMENEKLSAVMDNVEKVIVGKRTSIALLLTAMLAGGHILIEDVPGVGKPSLLPQWHVPATGNSTVCSLPPMSCRRTSPALP